MLAAVAVRMRAILVVMILGAASLSLADERPSLDPAAVCPNASDEAPTSKPNTTRM